MRLMVRNLRHKGRVHRTVKAALGLTNLGNNVSRIRRFQKEDLTLELKKSKDIMVE